MRDIFTRANVEYALLGGFLLQLTGSPRETKDVDMVFDTDRGMLALWDIVSPEPQYVLLIILHGVNCIWTLCTTMGSFHALCVQILLT